MVHGDGAWLGMMDMRMVHEVGNGGLGMGIEFVLTMEMTVGHRAGERYGAGAKIYMLGRTGKGRGQERAGTGKGGGKVIGIGIEQSIGLGAGCGWGKMCA